MAARAALKGSATAILNRATGRSVRCLPALISRRLRRGGARGVAAQDRRRTNGRTEPAHAVHLLQPYRSEVPRAVLEVPADGPAQGGGDDLLRRRDRAGRRVAEDDSRPAPPGDRGAPAR